MIRDGTEMDYEQLRAEAAAAVTDAAETQREVAMALGVAESSVSRALKEPGPKFQELQTRIIERLTPYRIERHITFKAHRDT
jgi:predicted transcriptional regulator